jgi:hypothetical protein
MRKMLYLWLKFSNHIFFIIQKGIKRKNSFYYSSQNQQKVSYTFIYFRNFLKNKIRKEVLINMIKLGEISSANPFPPRFSTKILTSGFDEQIIIEVLLSSNTNYIL